MLDRSIYLPLENERERGDGERGEGMAIHHQDVVAHAVVKGELGQDVHACIAKLEQDHLKVRLADRKALSPSSLATLHFGNQ